MLRLGFTTRVGARLSHRVPRAPGAGRRHFSAQSVVTVLTESMQAAHAATGVPWWALIPLATFALRAVWTLPLALLQRQRIQRQNELRPIVSAMYPVFKLKLAQRAQRAQRERARLESAQGAEGAAAAVAAAQSAPPMQYEQIVLMANKERRRRQKELFRRHGIQLWKNMVLPAFQVPLWVAMSLTMRNLSGWLSWDSMANEALDLALFSEGALWFQDLTAHDPTHVLPVALAVVLLCNVEWTFRTLALIRPQGERRLLRPTLTDSVANVSRMLVVFMMAVAMNAPVALVLYWLSLQVFSLVQNVVLDLNFPMRYTPPRVAAKRASEGAQNVLRQA